LLTGVIVGLMPALAASRADERETLQQGTRSTAGITHRRFRSALIAIEVALAFLLTAGTGLLLKSLHRVLEVDPGFEAHGLSISGYSLAGTRYAKDEAITRFEREAMERVRSVPGVDAVAIVSTLPLGGSYDQCGFHIQERPLPNDSDAPSVDRYYVSADYFRTMGIRLLRGRFFTEADAETSSAPVAIISETAARQIWPNEDPLGKHVQLGGRNNKKPWATIVGIVGDVLQYTLDSSHTPDAYAVYTQSPDSTQTLLVRSRLNGNALQRSIEQAIATIDKDAVVDEVVPMERLLAASTAQRRFLATVIGCFGALALLLSVVGIYGVMAYQVAQRTGEIGIRMALGASSAAIRGQVVTEGMCWVFVGVAAGAAASLGLRGVLANQLYGVGPTDATAFIAASAVLLLSAFSACYVPARRATKVDLTVALRYE
jgi:putative ABC transport system permease protein